jgi:phosphotriesterase-related protein
VREIAEGVEGTGIKAGIIGEIGTDHDPYMSAQEERVLRAAARAQKRTGVAITLHTTFNPKLAFNQMDVLEEEGVDLRRVIVGHCDLYLSLDYHERVAKRGAYVQYDTFGRVNVYPDEQRVAMLAEMLKRGYVSQLLLSSDVTRRSNLHTYKGYGYDHVPVKIIPALKKAQVSDEEIHIMTSENPKRVLAF